MRSFFWSDGRDGRHRATRLRRDQWARRPSERVFHACEITCMMFMSQQGEVQDSLKNGHAWIQVVDVYSRCVNQTKCEVSADACNICIDRLLMSMESFSNAVAHQLSLPSTFFTAFDAASVCSRKKTHADVFEDRYQAQDKFFNGKEFVCS